MSESAVRKENKNKIKYKYESFVNNLKIFNGSVTEAQ